MGVYVDGRIARQHKRDEVVRLVAMEEVADFGRNWRRSIRCLGGRVSREEKKKANNEPFTCGSHL